MYFSSENNVSKKPNKELKIMFKSLLRKTINVADKLLGLRKIMREGNPEKGHLLAGDRAIEWSWVVAHLPKQACQVLDMGCVQSALTCIAARLGHLVTAVDLRDIEYEMQGVIFSKGDINDLDFGPKRFDVIINCSSIEHVGLHGRYGSSDAVDGDLEAMRRLRGLLASNGRMILTIPVGRDAVFLPYHRIYGSARLPALLQGFTILEEEFWTKNQNIIWKRCNKKIALATEGSESYYALGLFLLQKRDDYVERY
jgi:SAM-dependent methyltransferase